MRIEAYTYRDAGDGDWRFSRVDFGRVNLLVGATSSGKSRLLNTIFNLGRFVASNQYMNGSWDLTFEHLSHMYRWQLESTSEGEAKTVVREILDEVAPEPAFSLVQRDPQKFIFMGKDLPKLPSHQNSVTLLANEERIKPIHQAFSSILRRNFDIFGLGDATALTPVPLNLLKELRKTNDLDKLRRADLPLSCNLFLLSEFFKPVYSAISESYKSIFPFIADIAIRDITEIHKAVSIPGKVPVFCISEHKVAKWISIDNLSSGMKKVLLILTDIFLLPEGGVYLIDEYENSLGINAIEFLPSFILTVEKNLQFFITSHHPYIINKIPVTDWYVFHRRGSEVQIKPGRDLAERFGKSKQQAFVQLINDPFYLHGAE